MTAALPPGPKGAPAEYCLRLKSYALFLMTQHLTPVRRVSEILEGCFGIQISSGAIMQWSKDGFHGLEGFERDLKSALI